MLVLNELERLWKEAVVTYLNVLSWHLAGETEGNHDKPQDSRSVGLDLKLGHQIQRDANHSTTMFNPQALQMQYT
jgi:hypothetical protein